MLFTKDNFMSFYKGSNVEKAASDCYDGVVKALSAAGILTPLTLIGALATVRVEVGRNFKPIEEYASGLQYEYRHDLGNYRPGDGPKYKGRGWIQVTGYDNYKYFGDKQGIDLICHPERALEPEVSANNLALYFRDRGCNLACEKQDWTQVRKLVNGGSNGLTDFLSYVNQYLSVAQK